MTRQEWEVERLLTASSMSDIVAFLSQPPIDAEDVHNRLRQARDEALRDDRNARAALLEWILSAVETYLREGPLETPGGPPFARARRYADEPTLLGCWLAFRKAPEAEQRQILADFRRQTPAEFSTWDGGLERVYIVATALLGSREERLSGRLFWAKTCRDSQRPERAIFHAGFVLASCGESYPFQRAGAWAVLGNGQRDQGRYPEALDSYTEALGLMDDQRLPTADIQYCMAECCRAVGQSARGIALLTEVLARAHEVRADSRALRGRALTLRGLLLEDLGDYEGAASDHLLSAGIFAQLGDRHREFMALSNHAGTFSKRGRAVESIGLHRAIVRQVETWNQKTTSAAARNNLGRVLLGSGDLEGARKVYSEAFALMGGAMSQSTSLAARGLASVASLTGDVQGGAEGFDALADMAGLMGEDPDDALSHLYLGGSSRSGRKWSPDDLTPQVEGALAAGKTPLVVVHALNLARAYDSTGRPDEGTDFLLGLLARLDKRDEWPIMAVLRSAVADRLKSVPGRSDEALEVLRNGLAKVERRLERSILDARRSEILAEAGQLYESLIDLLVPEAWDDLPTDLRRRRTAEAFDLHEQARARSFLLRLARGPLVPPPDADPDLVVRETELLQQRKSLEESIRDAPHRAGSLTSLKELDAALDSVWEQLQPSAPGYVRLRRGRPLSLQELRELLAGAGPAPEVPTIVSYFCGARATVCFVLHPDGVLEAYRCSISAALVTEIARRLRAVFNGQVTYPGSPPIPRDRPGSRDLTFFDEIGAVLLPWVRGTTEGETICLTAHGPLHALPLHALPFRPGSGPDSRLGIRNPLFYVPSLTSLAYVLSRDAHPTERGVFVAGVASSDDAKPENFETDGSIFGSGWSVTEVTGVDVTPMSVIEGCRDRDVAHVSCHGFMDPLNPSHSGLVLSDGWTRPPRRLRSLPRESRRPFILTPDDLVGDVLRARLITLRGCMTAAQELDAGADEFVGLVRSLLHAGVGSVLAALWNVDQESSRKLLTAFYTGLGPHQSLCRSLWIAQRRMAAGGDPESHLYHWAPFVLVGDWR